MTMIKTDEPIRRALYALIAAAHDALKEWDEARVREDGTRDLTTYSRDRAGVRHYWPEFEVVVEDLMGVPMEPKGIEQSVSVLRDALVALEASADLSKARGYTRKNAYHRAMAALAIKRSTPPPPPGPVRLGGADRAAGVERE